MRATPKRVPKRAYVIGTFDTKAEELRYVGQLLREAGLPVALVDIGTAGRTGEVDVTAEAVASFHPQGPGAVLGLSDRGAAVTAMATALTRFLPQQDDIGGVIGLGGSGGTIMISQAMRTLPLGLPKIMVSTVASGDVSPYVDIYDIAMMFPVTDIAGLNRLSRAVLANAAHGLAGMMLRAVPAAADPRPSLGLSMFGVTTPCIQQLSALLSDDYECCVFHATGTGGRAMEVMAAAGLLDALVDITTTEAADFLLGGVCSAGPDRFEVAARTGLPWIGSCGALDMVNFFALETVPERYRQRRLHAHNANVTLMRTNGEELARIGTWIVEKLNRSPGPVRLLLPEGGLSMLDAPGQPFHDPAANAALFEAMERGFVAGEHHQIIRVPHHVNDAAFVSVVDDLVRDVMGRERGTS